MSIPASATTDLRDLTRATGAEFAGGNRVWDRLRHHPSALFGAGVLAFFLLCTLVGPLLWRYDPAHQVLADSYFGPSAAHPLGTDDLGRDELVRLFYGVRWTLALGFGAVALGIAIGVPAGAISGYYGGWPDLLIQRLVDVILAFPGFLLALALVAGLGVGLRNVVIAVGIASLPAFVRLVRASALSVRELPYVEAARALGVPSWRILLRHVIPNSLAPVIVQATLQLGNAILVAAGLGFLGLGVQPPTPEWGAMLGAGRQYFFSDPALVTYPGLAIFGAVLAFNLVGDGLRDALDPRLK